MEAAALTDEVPSAESQQAVAGKVDAERGDAAAAKIKPETIRGKCRCELIGLSVIASYRFWIQKLNRDPSIRTMSCNIAKHEPHFCIGWRLQDESL